MSSMCSKLFRSTLGKLSSVALLAMISPAVAPAQQMSVVNSPHNLSASGPGPVRATSEQQPCIFCHTPHHASNVKPLWNRNMSTATYTPYRSNSLQALPDQPTGTSKLCLSCHDGTIALGSVVSRQQEIVMGGSISRMPAGPSHIGTDLSDDHPVSFAYDQALLAKNQNLKSPTALPEAVKLDENQELQCTSCHEPHDNQYGNFLVMSNSASQLCVACHNLGATTVTMHTNCNSCHQPHTAPSGPYLLRGTTVTETCIASACHGSTASQARLNIAADLNKFSKHDTNSPVNLTDHVPNNAVCADCHDSHTMGNTDALAAPSISPRMGRIDGVSITGTKVAQAQNEYEVCFKCHADNGTDQVQVISRVLPQLNKRLQFAASAASFHPVAAPGKNPNVPSLLPQYSESSIIYCTDCHASNSATSGGGGGANGPHGSIHASVLKLNYTTTDGTAESAGAYALCYSCHDRTSILNNDSFAGHKQHIVDELTPCSACHDSHGIAGTQGNPAANANLINFDTSIVQRMGGRPIRYNATAGTCTLTCHGSVHNSRRY